MIKELWAKVSYFWFICMLALVGFFVGIFNVNADTITEWSTMQVRVQMDNHGTNQWTSWSTQSVNGIVTFNSSTLTYPVNAVSWRLLSSNGLSVENTYTFKFAYKPTPDAINPSSYYISNNSTGEQEDITCRVERLSSGYYWYTCTFTPEVSYTSSDYVYVKINFNGYYLTELRTGVRGYEERKGTNAVITEQTNNIINNQNENTQSIINNNNTNTQNIINNQNDDSVDNPSSMISDFEDMLPTNGVITNLIALPINMYTKIIDSINGTCSPIQLPFYRTENSSGSVTSYVTFPCKTLSELTNYSLSNIIDIIISGVMIYHISKKMVKAFHNFTSMKEGDVIND